MPSNSRLPTVTSDIPRDLRMFLERVRETLIDEGRVREIVRSIGSGGPGGPGDPAQPPEAPTAPADVFASGQPGSILVQWREATYRGHAHAQVWASETDDRGQAEAVGMAPGTSFVHQVGFRVGRYYWVRFVNTAGAFGPFNGEAGTYAESLEFELPEPPTDDLDNSELNRLLDERLAWLEDPTFGLRGEATRIRGEFNALLEGTIQDIMTDLDLIRDELEDILVTELFDPDAAYTVGDLVIWLNPDTGTSFIYQCKQDYEPPPTHLPSDEDYWNQVGDSASISAIVDDIAAAGLALQARYEVEDGEVITTMAAALLDVRAVLEDGDGNLLSAGALLSLTSRVTTAEGKITALATAMVNAGVLVEVDGVLVTSEAFLTLIARIEQTASNMLGNAEFMQADKVGETWPNEPPDRWSIARVGSTATVGTNFDVQSSPRSGDGVRALFLRSGTAMASGHSVTLSQAGFPVSEDSYYQASVYVGSPLAALRARIRITFDDPGATSFASPDVALTATGLGPSAIIGTTLTDYNRVAVFAQAPEGATTATVSILVTRNTANPAILYATRPFFGAATENQTVPSPWVPGIQSNAYRAAASAALALDLLYRSPEGPFATSAAFLQLKGQIDAAEDGLVATNQLALGVKSTVENPTTGLAATAAALDSLIAEVQTGPNNLTSLSSRISGVAATVANSSANLLQDVAFAKVDATDQTGAPWVRASSGTWATATYGRGLAGNTIPRIPESVAYIRKSGAQPTSGSAQWSQDVTAAAGQWYQFSAWLQSLRCTARLTLEFRSASASLASFNVDLVNTSGVGTTIAGYTRRHVAGVAPSGTTLARLTILATTATGADPYLFALRPFFGEAMANQAEPSPWLPPIADAFAFQELTSRVTANEAGIGANGALISGVDTRLTTNEGETLALSGAFSKLASDVSVAFENRLLRSEEFGTTPPWTVNNGSVSGTLVAVPGFSGLVGRQYRETTANNQHVLVQTAIPVEAGYAFTVSVYVKPAGGRHLVMRAIGLASGGGATGTGFWSFNPTTGAFLGTSGSLLDQSGAIEAVGDGWFRCSGAFRVPTSSVTMSLALFSANTAVNHSAPPSFTGSTSAGLDLFGAQVNAGLSPDSYRKTTSAALYGPIHDRLRAATSAITAVDAQVNDPVTGLPVTAAGYSALDAQVNGAGGIASQISGLQASVGAGGNFLADSEFQTKLDVGISWFTQRSDANYVAGPSDDPVWQLNTGAGEKSLQIFRAGTVAANVNLYGEIVQIDIPVVPGDRYQFSVYTGAHRTRARVFVFWYGWDGAFLSGTEASQLNDNEAFGGHWLGAWKRLFGFAVAPEGAQTAGLVMRSDWSNPGAGNPARANSYAYFVRPFFGTAGATQTEPSPWAAGRNPPIFAALQQEGMVWANEENGGTAGATYTMRLRAKDDFGEAQVGFGLGALKENGKWVADARFSVNRFAIMDPSASVDQNQTARPWAPSTVYAVGAVRSYYVSSDPAVSGVYRCTVAHTSGATPNMAYWTRIARYPFIVVDGVVYIDTAVIREGTIGTAKIGDLAVTNGKIASLSASKITAGNIAVNESISSSSFVAGSSGWIIRGNGSAEFGSAVIRGQLTAGQITDLSIGPSKLIDDSTLIMAVGEISGLGNLDIGFQAGAGGEDRIRKYAILVEMVHAKQASTTLNQSESWMTAQFRMESNGSVFATASLNTISLAETVQSNLSSGNVVTTVNYRYPAGQKTSVFVVNVDSTWGQWAGIGYRTIRVTTAGWTTNAAARVVILGYKK